MLTEMLFFLFFYNAGDVVDAVVPFMGESITDGTLATFLKSMYAKTSVILGFL